MAEFLGDQGAGGFLTEDLPTPSTIKGRLSTNMREQDLWATTGLTDAEARSVAQAQEEAMQVIGPGQALAPAGSVDVLDVLIDRGAGLDQLEFAEGKRREVEKVLRNVEEVTSVDVALSSDPLVSGHLWRIQHRGDQVRRQLYDMAEEFTGGRTDSVMELIDQIGYDIVTGWMDFIPNISGEGTEDLEISRMWMEAMRTLDDQEFQEFVAERVDWMTNSTIWSGEEAAWRVMREINAIDNAGAVLWNEENGVLIGAITSTDFLALGVSSIGRGIGKSVVGRLRNTAGTLHSTLTATKAPLVRGLRKTADDIPPVGRTQVDIADADLVDDIAPEHVSTTIRTVNTPPPVSQTMLGNTFRENIFVQRFLARQQAKSFGTFNITEGSMDWAQNWARVRAEAAGSDVISVSVREEGIKRATASIQFGKKNGKPFKSYEAARRRAEEIPGSVVIDSRVGGPALPRTSRGEFVVQADVNVPIKDLVSATNLEDVKKRLPGMAWFGRADLGSSSFMSNLADAADAGAQGFNKDFDKLVRGIHSGDTKAIDDILTTLRDTPTEGNPRTWLSSSEFGEAYYQLKGEYPSRKTVQAYETAVAMSDFSWWVRAEERLAQLANNKAMVANINGFDAFVFPSTKTADKVDAQVWDLARGRRVHGSDLPEGTKLMKMGEKNDQQIEYVAYFADGVRKPDLDDAFPYNAGGPRSNPDAAWFIGNNDGRWATLISARSEKDAIQAVTEYNTIASTLPKNIDSMDLAARGAADDLIRANNNWNPDIEDLDDFVDFTKSRGVPHHEPVDYRARGTRLIDSFRVNTIDGDEATYLDISIEDSISYKRHDIPLVEFGGAKASNPHPLLAIHSQFNHMVTDGARMQYRMNHPTAWVKALENAIDRKIVTADIPRHPMTDANKVKTIKIDTSTEAGRKLAQEQSVILRRLDMYQGSEADVLASGYEKATKTSNRMLEVVHDWVPNGYGWAQTIKGTLDNSSNTLLSLGFFQKMASIDQLLLQSTHAIPIMSISPVNGARGLTISTIIRQAAREGSQSVWDNVATKLRVTTGLDEVEFKALKDHMLDSGRGYMKGAIAEDPYSGVGNSMLRKFKDVTSTPYYAGENFSATLSRVTAFLDVRKKSPNLDVNSDEFWNAVQARDRDLSFALNKSQKSIVQSDALTRVATQWTSYPLRTLESIFFNGNLTKAERGRLAGATTILWGVAGLGSMGVYHKVADKLEDWDVPEGMTDVILHGADVAIDNLTGIRPGRRIAARPVELWERAVNSVMAPHETIPAWIIAQNSVDHGLSALVHAMSGRIDLLSHDAERFARLWKVVDSGFLAYTMAAHDARRKSSGKSEDRQYTSMEVLWQAIGVEPGSSTLTNHGKSLMFNLKERKAEAVKKATPYFRDAVLAGQEGDYDRMKSIMLDVDWIVGAYDLPDSFQAEARDEIIRAVGYDDLNWLTINLIKAGYQDLANRIQRENE